MRQAPDVPHSSPARKGFLGKSQEKKEKLEKEMREARQVKLGVYFGPVIDERSNQTGVFILP